MQIKCVRVCATTDSIHLRFCIKFICNLILNNNGKDYGLFGTIYIINISFKIAF